MSRISTYINVPTEQAEAAAPFDVRRPGEFGRSEASINLDTVDGEIFYDTCPDPTPIPSVEYLGQVISWSLRADVRGSYLVPLAKKLQRLIQQVLDGSSDGDHDGKPCTVLDEDALAASDKIRTLLDDGGIIDSSDPYQVAEVRTVGDYVDAPPDGLTVTTTDAEIAELASELESEADSDGIILDGCMTDWLVGMRDELRKEAGDAA